LHAGQVLDQTSLLHHYLPEHCALSGFYLDLKLQIQEASSRSAKYLLYNYKDIFLNSIFSNDPCVNQWNNGLYSIPLASDIEEDDNCT
jgi:hypothetical protein